MGDDPKTSVLNKWSQSHDHKNLFVVDGAGFTSAGWQNPTTAVLERRVAALEGGIEAMCVSSGQAAVNYAVQNIAELLSLIHI